MSTGKKPREENLTDLDRKPLDDADADAVKGGGGTSPGYTAPAPVLKPISPRTIIPCI